MASQRQRDGGASRALSCLANRAVCPSANENANRRVVGRISSGRRHELLSVRFAEAVAAVKELDAGLARCALALIASHRRPLPPVRPFFDVSPVLVQLPHDGQSLSTMSNTGLERLDSGESPTPGSGGLFRGSAGGGLPGWIDGHSRRPRASEAEQNQAETGKIDKEDAA